MKIETVTYVKPTKISDAQKSLFLTLKNQDYVSDNKVGISGICSNQGLQNKIDQKTF